MGNRQALSKSYMLLRTCTDYAALAMRLEPFEGVKRRYPLITFDKPESLEACKKMPDMDLRCSSTVNLDYVQATPSEPAHARWHGSISTQLPPDNMQMQRSGFAGWRTRDKGWSMWGKSLWDLDP